MMPLWLPSMCSIQPASALWIAYDPALPKGSPLSM